MSEPTILIVPGLRGEVPTHWQTLLEASLREQGRAVVAVPALGREDLDCARRVAAIEAAVAGISGEIVAVAHSGGCLMLAHWAQNAARRIKAALLATPPDFETTMPAEYPSLAALEAAGWLPLPRRRLPFACLVAASRNDPLGSFERVSALARDWGSELLDLGEVGHLTPASGYGPWPPAETLIDRLLADRVAA